MLEKKLVEAIGGMIQGHATRQLNGSIVSVGVAPHMYQKSFVVMLNLLDSVLGSPRLDATTKERMLAQTAFVGYMINRPDYWDASRGFGAMFGACADCWRS